MGDAYEPIAGVIALLLAVWGVGRPLLRFLVKDHDGILPSLLFSVAVWGWQPGAVCWPCWRSWAG